MESAPLHRLKKSEIVWLGTHRCKAHSHTYLAHYQCFLREKPQDTGERIATLDIETSNLDADYGIILSWCVKPVGGKIISDVITLNDIKKGRVGDEDRRVTQSLINTITDFDVLIGYYSKRYDIPYIRARAVHMGLTFPVFGTIKHIDVYDIIKHKFKMSRRRQETACRFLLGKTEKTHFSGHIWRDAARGIKSALAYVLDHNEGDVRDLEALYATVAPFVRRNDSSI